MYEGIMKKVEARGCVAYEGEEELWKRIREIKSDIRMNVCLRNEPNPRHFHVTRFSLNMFYRFFVSNSLYL